MAMIKHNRDILRQPKIYSAPKERDIFVLPKYAKIILVAALLFLLIIYILFFSPLFTIKRVDVLGTSVEDVRNETVSYYGKNIFLANVELLENDLVKQKPEYLQIRVYRGIPSILRIRFEERQPKIVWQSKDKRYYVDENAIAFKEADDIGGFPLVIDNSNLEVKIPSKISSPNFISFVRNLGSSMSRIGNKIDRYEINETTFQLNAYSENIKIIFNTARPLSEQISVFEKVNNEHKKDIKEYIDVRVEGWAYYK